LKILSVLLIIFLFSCAHDKSHDTKHEHSEIKEELRLNDGKKWIANKETIEGIENMSLSIDKFNKNEMISDSLLSSLLRNFNYIFDKCTMKGVAHDQLHLYMIPLKDFIQKIKNSEAEHIPHHLEEMSKHLQNFSNYFEQENA
jgi:hypothetical protein